MKTIKLTQKIVAYTINENLRNRYEHLSQYRTSFDMLKTYKLHEIRSRSRHFLVCLYLLPEWALGRARAPLSHKPIWITMFWLIGGLSNESAGFYMACILFVFQEFMILEFLFLNYTTFWFNTTVNTKMLNVIVMLYIHGGIY